MIRDARDLIIRQKAEIERLEEKRVEDEKLLNDRVIQSVNAVSEAHRKYENALEEQLKTVKAEAYKEFAARVNEKLQNLARMHMQHGSDDIYFLVSESFIDNVLKELMEEKK